MSETTSGTGKKYAGIDRAGTAALYQEGSIKEFPGFPESLNNRFNVSLLFTPDSEAEFKRRVTDPLREIGNELGIEFYLASRDFRIHSTLLEGLYEGTDTNEGQNKFERIKANQTVQSLDNLVGKTLQYKYLLIDKGNILLTAIDIPEWVLKARTDLSRVYSEQGLKPLNMTNILHISVGRMTQLPSKDRAEKFKTYRQEVAHLRHQISSSPLVLEVGTVSRIPPLELLQMSSH